MYTYKPEKCRVPIKIWSKEGSIEQGALEQIGNVASLPFAFHHVALMPDGHQGYGMPIGGVLATSGIVIPNAVGVDIGCGMCAVRTSLTELSTERLKEIMGLIRKRIPVGFDHHRDVQDENLMPFKVYHDHELEIVSREYQSALHQLGTLGGGNHFIEIQKGSDGYIWFMIHSGSRNLGLKVAKHYNELAIELNKRWYSQVPEKWELAFLPMDTDEAKLYLAEMNYCLEFARANRFLMAERIKQSFKDVPCGACEGRGGFNGNKCVHCNGTGLASTELGPMQFNVEFEELINIHHNYAVMEHHFGHNVMVHRKGATSAKDGQVGVIPGSQGTSSYIVKGKGNPDSFMSCSHGAGRRMGRKQACRELKLEDEVKLLNDQGIIHAIRGVKDLDEAAGAYKNIDEVIREESDLIEVVVKLTPLGVIKG